LYCYWICHPDGFGLSNPNNIADAAFISSIIAAMDEILVILPMFKHDCLLYFNSGIPNQFCALINNFVDAFIALKKFDNSLDIQIYLDYHINADLDIQDIQHNLTELVLNFRLKEFTNFIRRESISTQQSFENFNNESTKSFLKVVAKNNLDPNFMDDLSFRFAFLRRCMLPIPSISIDQTCQCSPTQKVDGYGHHLLKCNQITSSNGKCQQIWAHDNFLNNFIDLCRFNGVKVDKEVLLRTFLNQIGEDNNKRMDAVLKLPNTKGNGFIKIAVDGTIISGITKSQENGTSGVLIGNSIFNRCELIKQQNYVTDCNANNIKYFTFAITKDGGLSNESKLLLDKIEHHGTITLKRTQIQHNYFRKKLSIKVINDQSKIINDKINGLIEHTNKKLLSQMEEISSFLTIDNVFEFDFPLEDPSVSIYKQTAEDFENGNIIDHDDSSTVIDDFNLGNFDVINNLLHVDRIHIDHFGDDLESLDSNSENNDLCVDDDVH